MKVFLIINW